MASDGSDAGYPGPSKHPPSWGPKTVPYIPPPPLDHVLTQSRSTLDERRMLGGRLVKVAFVLDLIIICFFFIEVATFSRLAGPGSTLPSDRRVAMGAFGDFVTLVALAHIGVAFGVWIVGSRIQSGSKLSPWIAIAAGAASIAGYAIPIYQLFDGSLYLLDLPADASYSQLVVAPFVSLLGAGVLLLLGGIISRYRPVRPYASRRKSRRAKAKAKADEGSRAG
ncbi:MAG TPA: hypothetical protein VJ326_07640 [Thermoplasmata archaeon]|nr:hypothetical protein [Thermoplasmata archaeon]